MAQLKRTAIFTAAVFLVIAATLVNNPQVFFMASLLFVLPLISYFVGTFALRKLEFERVLPATGWEGETLPFTLKVRSQNPLPRYGLRLDDDLPEWLTPDNPDGTLFNALPQSETVVPYRVQLNKRGIYRLSDVLIGAYDPLGLYMFTKKFELPGEIVVYPNPQEIDELLLTGAERYGVRDMPFAAIRGSGVDPDGVREYVPGDPLRRMHWKSTARTGKLSVIEFEESRAINVVLVMDLHLGTNVGDGKETTLEYMVLAAASLAQLAVRQGASVRLVTGHPEDLANVAGRGSDHLYTVLASLARVEATDRELLSHRLVERVGILQPGTTLIVLTADCDRELRNSLLHYVGAGINTLVIYADPRAFNPRSNVPTRQVQSAFVEALSSVHIQTMLLQPNAERKITLEAVEDVRSLHTR